MHGDTEVMTEKEFEELYDKYKEVPPIVKYMVSLKSLPQTIAEKMLTNKLTEDSVIRELLKKEVGDEVLDYIYANRKYAIANMSKQEISSEIPRHSLSYLAEKAYFDDTITGEQLKELSFLPVFMTKILTSFSDTRLAEEMYKKNVDTEELNSMIASNINLPDDVRHKFFRLGYNYNYIVATTDEMTNEMYKNTMEAMDIAENSDFFTTLDREAMVSNVNEFLLSLCNNYTTNESVELDILNRMFDKYSLRKNVVLNRLFETTEYESVIKKGTESKNVSLLKALCHNKRVPDKFLSEYLHKCCIKLKKAYLKDTTGSSISASLLNLTCTCFDRVTATREDYKTVLETGNICLSSAIATSKKTPVFVLDNIIRMTNHKNYKHLCLEASVNKFAREMDVSGKIMPISFDVFIQDKKCETKFREMLKDVREKIDKSGNSVMEIDGIIKEFDEHAQIHQSMLTHDYTTLGDTAMMKMQDKILDECTEDDRYKLYTEVDDILDDYLLLSKAIEERIEEEKKEIEEERAKA